MRDANVERLRAAAHAVDVPTDVWLDDVCRAAAPILGHEDGLFAYTYRVERAAMRIEALTSDGAPAGFWDALRDWGAENTKLIASICRTHATSLSVLEAELRARGVVWPSSRRWFDPYGVRDLLTVNAHQRSGRGLFLTAPRTRGLVLRGARRQLFERLASELTLALRFREMTGVGLVANLSPREAEVLRLIACGERDKQIAARLHLSLSSVATYAKRAREKLGLGAREPLVRLAPMHTRTLRLALFRLLTPSEHEVAAELISGASYAEIARARGSRMRTVASQAASIFRKCGVSGRRELAASLLGTSGA